MSDTDISRLLRTTFYYHADIGGHIIQVHEQQKVRQYLRTIHTPLPPPLQVLEAALQR